MSFTLPLISPLQLSEQLNDPSLVILDASMPPVGNMDKAKVSWPDVVIPCARRFDIAKDFSDHSSQLPYTMLSAEHFERACQLLGINQDSHIVVYDDLGMFSSARAWYMLKAMGHHKVQVLNGGLPEWRAQSFATEAASDNVSWPKGNFKARFDVSRFIDADGVEAATHNENIKILDARAFNRFTGEASEPRAGMRSGHIPNSHSFPYTHLLDQGVMKCDTALRASFDILKIAEGDSFIMSCGSGITACILALAAHQLGMNNVSVYDGSWSEWGADDSRPIGIGI